MRAENRELLEERLVMWILALAVGLHTVDRLFAERFVRPSQRSLC